ncbi:unnamed protein product [Diatraea saccharalis]|uniref:MADF domain-containing protein n=1 Tax=Diatraea saccharalis TaxID=40085 RepID=A0A9N9N4V6_9NEOP|nr:unnamed protein product [Diatraea saccharalis]
MKSDPNSLERLRERERLKYMKKKEKGQVRPTSNMNPREKWLKRKSWKKNSQTYRDKQGVLRKNLTRLLDITPPPSPGPSFQNVRENREEQQREEHRRLSSIAQRKRQLRRRRAILYAIISKLQKSVDDERRKGEKFRKRYQRLAKKVQSSPEAKVSELLENIQVPDTVKKRLIFSEKRWKNLKDQYRKELKKLPAPRSGDPGDNVQSTWQFFSQMNFLRFEILRNSSDTNLRINNDGDQSSSTMSLPLFSPHTEINSQESVITETDVRSPTEDDDVTIETPTNSQLLMNASTSSSRPRKRKTANDIRTEMLELEKKRLLLLEKDNRILTQHSQVKINHKTITT